MTKPRINLMIMTEGEIDRPIRSYFLPWYTPKLLIWLGGSLAVACVLGLAALIYLWDVAGRVSDLKQENASLQRSVTKITELEAELAFHRDFTGRVAGLIGIAVPDFTDSAESYMSALADTAPSSRAGDQTVPTLGDLDGNLEFNALGVSVTECAPDPNNRPRGMPLVARISRGFAPFEDNPALQHDGIDLAVREGVPVLATADGVVEFAGAHDLYGLHIILDHENGFKTAYGHNSVILIRSGESVRRGDRIAFSGNTGVSTAPHLHYQITENGKPADPTGFLGR